MYTLYYRWKDRRTDEKINNAYMKFIIEPGTSADINELEKLYDELNDYLAGTISYPGWIKGDPAHRRQTRILRKGEDAG